MHARVRDQGFSTAELHTLLGCSGSLDSSSVARKRWKALIENNWQLVGLFAKKLHDADVRRLPVPRRPLQTTSIAATAQWLAELQFAELQRLGQILSGADIPYCFIKGAASCLHTFQPGERLLGDIDIAVDPLYIERARRLLKRNRYHTCGWNASRWRYERLSHAEAAAQEAGHYELCMLVKRRRVARPSPSILEILEAGITWFSPMIQLDRTGAVFFTSEVDLHHAMAINYPFDGFVEGSVSAPADPSIRVSNIAQTFAHIAFKLYFEANFRTIKGSHQYADLVRLAALMSDADWRAVFSQLDRWRASVVAYNIVMRLGLIDPRCITSYAHLQAHSRKPKIQGPAAPSKDPVWSRLWSVVSD